MRRHLARGLKAVVLCGVWVVSFAQNALPAKGIDRIVMSQRGRVDGKDIELDLHRIELPKPSTTSRLRYMFHTDPKAGADSNVAYLLVARSIGQKSGKVLWITYSVNWRPPFSYGVFLASFLLTDDPDWNVRLVTASNAVDRPQLGYYKVDATTMIADYPLELDPEIKETWPDPSKPVSFLRDWNDDEQRCEVKSLMLQREGGDLVVTLHRSQECGDAIVAISKSEKWSLRKR